MEYTKQTWRLLEKLLCMRPEPPVWPSAVGLSMHQSGSFSTAFHHLSLLTPANDCLLEASRHSHPPCPGPRHVLSATAACEVNPCHVLRKSTHAHKCSSRSARESGGQQCADSNRMQACSETACARAHAQNRTISSSRTSAGRHAPISSTGSTHWTSCVKAHLPLLAAARGLSTSRASPEQAAGSNPGSDSK
ncbi:hypothetical protein DUNSADRAFT_1621 [Dunaliella salina]|uniref:Encoded protein n=1 Tax=Dunaliella salina TaxID=3046 RepID=A0ABQ7H8K7_DUNSA|nr:hypothetical protein DUNSADRAFT_1621 [Dunaliella salina]|eukprot:KAF5843194.1 hypothetical protein DUNSADRAFT_1621 [Dunaliella salina]